MRLLLQTRTQRTIGFCSVRMCIGAHEVRHLYMYITMEEWSLVYFWVEMHLPLTEFPYFLLFVISLPLSLTSFFFQIRPFQILVRSLSWFSNSSSLVKLALFELHVVSIKHHKTLVTKWIVHALIHSQMTTMHSGFIHRYAAIVFQSI